MPIHFIPNDPVAAKQIKPRRVKPSKARSAKVAGFDFGPAVAEDVYDPATPEFLYWQVREAALQAVAAWEDAIGPLKAWAPGGPRALPVKVDAGTQLNAFYDRFELSFFHGGAGFKPTYTGASTDCVSHETGHALLDSIRPDLWSVNTLEAGAFHEAFGDCVALITALRDADTRKVVRGSLAKKNPVEALIEDLGKALEIGPRHALNTFQWDLPENLPLKGPPHASLIREVHSFGQVFVGCFYDLVRNLYDAGAQTDAGLVKAARIATKLLVEGTRDAVVTPRFFQSVGRTMALVDDRDFKGKHRPAIAAAFSRHNIPLGSSAMLSPRASLRGSLGGARRAAVPTAIEDDLRERLGSDPGARLEFSRGAVGGVDVTRAVQRRAVDLGSLDKRLKGVVAHATESVLLQQDKGARRAAIVSSLPNASTSRDEVLAFVESLLHHGGLVLDGTAGRGRRAAASPARGAGPRGTHAIQDGELVRLRFD